MVLPGRLLEEVPPPHLLGHPFLRPLSLPPSSSFVVSFFFFVILALSLVAPAPVADSGDVGGALKKQKLSLIN